MALMGCSGDVGYCLSSWKRRYTTVYDKMRLGLWTCNEIPCKTCWHYDIKKKATYEMLRCRESIKLLHQSNGIDTPHWRPFDAMEERLFATELHFHSTCSVSYGSYYLKYPWKVYISHIKRNMWRNSWSGRIALWWNSHEPWSSYYNQRLLVCDRPLWLWYVCWQMALSRVEVQFKSFPGWVMLVVIVL